MAFSTEDAVFFVFDNDLLKDEYDFVEDGILYFSPFAIEKSEKYGLVSHLIGISRFLQMTFGSPASVYCLQDAKIAFRHVEHYTLGLSGKVFCPSNHLLDLLNRLVEMFRFYRGGFHILEKVCAETGKGFLEELQISWDCFKAFIKRYGDSVSSYFQSLPILRVAKEIEPEVFIQSAHLLEELCRLVPGAKAGCLLYDNHVCYSQLTPDLTSRLTVIRPKQQNLPCQLLPTGLDLQGVRLFKVYLTQDEVLSLGSMRHFPSFPSADSLSLKKTSDITESSSNVSHASTARPSYNETTAPDSEIDIRREELRNVNRVTCCDSSNGDTLKVDATEGRSVATKQLPSEEREISSKQLVELEMYVQGTSDSVCILLMESGSLADVCLLKKTWQHILLSISEVERLIRATTYSPTDDVESKAGDDGCRYLVFNRTTGELSGNLLQPVTSPEHSFCQVAQAMHKEFKLDADTVEITLRTHQSVFSGIQTGYEEFFCWSTGFPPKPGLPSVTADGNTEQLVKKLRDIKLHRS